MTEPTGTDGMPGTRLGPLTAQRLARIVTEVFAPAVLATVLLVTIGWHAYQYSWTGVAWGLFAALFASVIPFAVIIRGVRRGVLTDHHIGRREQRRIPLLIALGCLVFGLVALVVLGAHRELLAGLVAGGLVLLVSVIVNLWWKMSVHTGVAAGVLVILAEAFGGWALFATPLVALVAWSRVYLRDHTFVQVVMGAVLGVLVAGSSFAALR